MSFCPYYLRGNCRFGNRCRMAHVNSNGPPVYNQNNPSFRPRNPRQPINPNYNYVAPSAASRNHNIGNTGASQRENSKYVYVFTWVKENFVDQEKALDILQQLQTEAKAWQKSIHFWRFTSRSLFPGGRPLEGWIDQSFEEVKWLHREMTSRGQEHIYKKGYFDYWENTERQLVGLSKLNIETLKTFKDYIDQYVVSNHKPSKTLSTDIEMKDVNDNTTSNVLPQIQSTNYTPEDQLLEDERAAFQSDTFEFGQIPVHAPSQQFS